MNSDQPSMSSNQLAMKCDYYQLSKQLLIIEMKVSLEKFNVYQFLREIHETFPPQTICNIQYAL